MTFFPKTAKQNDMSEVSNDDLGVYYDILHDIFTDLCAFTNTKSGDFSDAIKSVLGLISLGVFDEKDAGEFLGAIVNIPEQFLSTYLDYAIGTFNVNDDVFEPRFRHPFEHYIRDLFETIASFDPKPQVGHYGKKEMKKHMQLKKKEQQKIESEFKLLDETILDKLVDMQKTIRDIQGDLAKQVNKQGQRRDGRSRSHSLVGVLGGLGQFSPVTRRRSNSHADSHNISRVATIADNIEVRLNEIEDRSKLLANEFKNMGLQKYSDRVLSLARERLGFMVRMREVDVSDKACKKLSASVAEIEKEIEFYRGANSHARRVYFYIEYLTAEVSSIRECVVVLREKLNNPCAHDKYVEAYTKYLENNRHADVCSQEVVPIYIPEESEGALLEQYNNSKMELNSLLAYNDLRRHIITIRKTLHQIRGVEQDEREFLMPSLETFLNDAMESLNLYVSDDSQLHSGIKLVIMKAYDVFLHLHNSISHQINTSNARCSKVFMLYKMYVEKIRAYNLYITEHGGLDDSARSINAEATVLLKEINEKYMTTHNAFVRSVTVTNFQMLDHVVNDGFGSWGRAGVHHLIAYD